MRIGVGIGGWIFEDWRGTFYPPGLAKTKELAYAAGHLSAIEINGTFYGAQKPASFRRWHDETPEDFIFSLKGPRFATHRRELAEAGSSIDRFFESGVLELGKKLGPVLWQFPATRAFDTAGFSAFVDLLPKGQRHVIEAAHPSFSTKEALAFFDRTPLCLLQDDKHAADREPAGDFVYARLKGCVEEEETGYSRKALDAWAKKVKAWSKTRDCFIFFIAGAKVRAPAAAQALLKRLQEKA